MMGQGQPNGLWNGGASAGPGSLSGWQTLLPGRGGGGGEEAEKSGVGRKMSIIGGKGERSAARPKVVSSCG